MERLAVNRRPKPGDKVECLPAGDGLPIWSTIPLDAKLPMMKNPKGSVTLFTTKLGEPKHKCKQEYDFDLRDPYGKYICNEYKPLHDPHLKAHFKSQVMRRHLIRKGFISEDGKVLCSLKEFNQYRQYLRHVFFLEIARERKEELEKIHRQTSEQRMHDVDRRLSRGTIVRERLQKQREQDMHRINTELTAKAERLEKRLQELRNELTTRERKRREETERRQQNVYKNQHETEQRKYVLIKKWRQQERLRSKLMEDREIQRKLQAEMKCLAKWKERKFAQQGKLAYDEEIIKQEDEERQRNITRREQVMLQQRHRLEAFQVKTADAGRKRKRDHLYAKRFEEKLASGDYRVWTKRRDKRRSRGKTFISTWKLEDILSNLTLTDIHKESREQPFMAMLVDEALDESSDITSQTEEADLEALHEKAREIVQGVISKVTNEIFPAYLKMMSEDDGKAAIQSRSVRFCTDEDQIEIGEVISIEGMLDSEYIGMRPVSEHILTPVASQLEIQKLEAEAILGSPEVGDKTSSVTFVETLLLRLLDDLNSGKLTNNDIMKLASYSMDIIQSTETRPQKDGAIAEETDTESIFEASSSSSIIAKRMVDFTLGKILFDVQMGNVHPDELASLTLSLLDDTSPSAVSSASIVISETELENYIDETLRAATSSALDPREDSPVCEALLDEFMVNTLKNLIQDLENDVLSKSQIETLAVSVRDETKNILPTESDESTCIYDSTTLQRILSELLQQLQNEQIDVHNLYQIVFAIVYSYNMLKAPPTPCYENRITNLMKDVLHTAEQKAIAGELDNINANIMHEANERLSHETLDVNQIEQISSSIISTISRPEVICRTSTSDIARSIVEEALTRAKQQIENENAEERLTQGVQNVAEAVIFTTANKCSTYKNEVSGTLLEVLKNLRSVVVASGVIEESDIEDIDILISQISKDEIDSEKIEEIAHTIARVLKSPVKSQSSISANLVVADVLQQVNKDLQQGSIENVIINGIMEVVSLTVRAAQKMDVHSPALLNALSSFLKTVLSYVSRKVQTGEFNEQDIKELTKTMKDTIGQNDALLGLKESVFESAELEHEEQINQITSQTQKTFETETVLEHFQRLLDDIETGNIPNDVVTTLGKRLIKCGKTLLDNLSGCSSAALTPGSNIIADDVVEEVIRTLQLEIVRGSLTQDNVKEITKSIISSTSSRSDLAEKVVGHTIRGIHRDVERGFEPARLPSIPTLDQSPSASTVASQVVLHTIEAIQNDFSLSMLSDSLIVSIASSLIALITEDQDRPFDLPNGVELFKDTISTITNCLKNDSIARPEAERIFCIILENYKDFVCGRDQKMEQSLSADDTALISDLVTETLHNIERSVQRGMLSMKEFSIPSLPQSEGTSLAAEDLVEQCLDTIRQDLSTVHTFHQDQYNDISEFILDIIKKMKFELSQGTISNLSMAHFFQVISDNRSDLKTLEESASENLSNVIEDIQTNKTKSVYIHRILETYLTSEPISNNLFSDPVKAVESILISVSSEILTKFVKATLQNILIEMREGSFSAADKTPSAFAIRSASSLIAENVIQEVISRIKEDMTKSVHKIHGKVSKQELERAASKLLCGTPVKNLIDSTYEVDNKQTGSHQSLSSVKSKDIEDIVLETLHNMVSNLRFEQSVHTHKHGKNKDDHSSDMSSEVQDFVLHSLQNIVTDLQDRRSQMELGVTKSHSKNSSAIELVSGENREATAYVNDVLATVLNEMKQEIINQQQHITDVDERSGDSFPDSSTLETVILECLQNAIRNEPVKNEVGNLDQHQRRDVQQIVVETISATLKNIDEKKLSQNDLMTVNNALVKFLDGRESKKQEMSLQEYVRQSLKKVLTKVQETNIDDAMLNRIATQVATLGMDINATDRRSPVIVGSNSSVSSSALGDLVKDVLFKITQQMEDEMKQATTAVIDETHLSEDTDLNFNRKISASSSRSGTIIETENPLSNTKGPGEISNSFKRKEATKNNTREPQKKVLIEKQKTSSKASRKQTSPIRSSKTNTRQVKTPTETKYKSPKAKKDRTVLHQLASPRCTQTTVEAVDFKTPSAVKCDIKAGIKSVSAKCSKSENISRKGIGKGTVPVSKTVLPGSAKLERNFGHKISKKKKSSAKKETTPNAVSIEDSSVLKSLCGAHKTKISIREEKS